jgi:transposase
MQARSYKNLNLASKEKLLHKSWTDSKGMPPNIANRVRMVALIAEGKPVYEVARIYGVSRSCVYKWLSRYESLSSEWYLDRPRRPKTNPRKTPPEIESTIIFVHNSLKQACFQSGAKSIKYELERLILEHVPSISTINRILRKHGLRNNYPKSKRPKQRVRTCNQERSIDPRLSSHKVKPKRSLFISLTTEEKETLEGWKRSTMTEAGIAKRSELILLLAEGQSASEVAKILRVSRQMVYKWAKRFSAKRVNGLYRSKPNIQRKYENESIKSALFELIHSPPAEYGINRTSWKLDDLKKCLSEKGIPISKGYIRKMIKSAGYSWRKARIVLTSNDPEYRTKLNRVQKILSTLGENDRFFSIDEFGPVAIRTRGGRKLVGPNDYHSVPQFQKSKGRVIVTAALELTTNQLTHFYSDRKNTAEMIKLLEILIKEYPNADSIFLSWDNAKWHASKRLKERVKEINSAEYRDKQKSPFVKLAPLPSGAQFLNVIESVFSGMARAIIHNSDYQSVDECKEVIDKYIEERNEYFKENPKRAGKKIWGQERVKPVFSEANNCKDPRY